MSRASIQVNEYSYSWLQKGFDWVYKKEIKKKKGNPIKDPDDDSQAKLF